PSSVAVEHVIEKFQAMFFAEETKKYVFAVDPLLKFLAHRPLHCSDEEWSARCAEKEETISKLLHAIK
ncbi:MAG: hypothetical protein ACKOZM_02705, partial [Flavobacteriales bacterium]